MNFLVDSGTGRLISRIRSLFAAVIVIGAVTLSSTAFAQSLVEGLRLYNLGNYDGAMKEWQPLANKGNPDALFNLAQIHRLGRGVPVNLPVAEGYYAKAAEAGHVTAQANLATIYYFNKGNATRRAEAVRLWRLAGAAGDASSQYMLAVLHNNGEVVEKDTLNAYAWILLAVDGGHQDAVQAEAIIGAALDEAQREEARRISYTLLTPPTDGMLDPAGDESPSKPAVLLVAKDKVTPGARERVAATPAPAPAASATPAPSSTVQSSSARAGDYRSLDGRWRVQLGSFREARNADDHRAQIEDKMSSNLAGLWWDLARLDLGADKGVYYRLLIGPLRDRSGADTICEALKAGGFDCFVVAP